MPEKLTWDEIKRRYPDEWVAIVDFELDGDLPTAGIVADHGPAKREVYSRLQVLDREWSVRYTGKMRPGIVLGGFASTIGRATSRSTESSAWMCWAGDASSWIPRNSGWSFTGDEVIRPGSSGS